MSRPVSCAVPGATIAPSLSSAMKISHQRGSGGTTSNTRSPLWIPSFLSPSASCEDRSLLSTLSPASHDLLCEVEILWNLEPEAPSGCLVLGQSLLCHRLTPSRL